MTDSDLIEKAKKIAGGTQGALANLLGVSQSAISHWVASGLPVERRRELEDLLRGKTPPRGIAILGVRGPSAMQVADANRCGFSAESAWSLHFIEEPGDVLVTRTWNNVTASRTTVFRHHLRKFVERHPIGIGFLEPLSLTNPVPGFVTVSRQIGIGPVGNGGFRERLTVIRGESGNAVSHGYAAFKSECPTEVVNVIVSIPKGFLGSGPVVAYSVAGEVSQQGVVTSILSGSGRIEEIIEPWGRQIAVERLRPEVLRGPDSWSSGWDPENYPAQDLVKETCERFEEADDREVFLARATDLSPFARVVLLWPLPRRKNDARNREGTSYDDE